MKTLYIDMDNVLVDFQSGIDDISQEERTQFKDDLDEVPGIFSKMVPGAGLEPARKIIPRDFKSLVSTNFTTRAFGVF